MGDRGEYSALAPGRVCMRFYSSTLLGCSGVVSHRPEGTPRSQDSYSRRMPFAQNIPAFSRTSLHCPNSLKMPLPSQSKSQSKNLRSSREQLLVPSEQVLLSLLSLPLFLLWFWASSSVYELGIRAAALSPVVMLLISTSRPQKAHFPPSRRLL